VLCRKTFFVEEKLESSFELRNYPFSDGFSILRKLFLKERKKDWMERQSNLISIHNVE
jgi:hypothetical protein